jgi:hypothetical protein
MSNNSKPLSFVAAGVAAVLLAFGAYALGKSSSNDGTTTAPAAAQLPSQNGQVPQADQSGQVPGQAGRTPPGFGTDVTGAAANKAKAAALAKYDGTAERVMKLGDGSYVVHVLTSSGEYHVLVSKDFKVTGAQQGGPGRGGGTPGAGAPQTGGASTGSAS